MVVGRCVQLGMSVHGGEAKIPRKKLARRCLWRRYVMSSLSGTRHPRQVDGHCIMELYLRVLTEVITRCRTKKCPSIVTPLLLLEAGVQTDAEGCVSK